MPVSLAQLREEMLPGLLAYRNSYSGMSQWDAVFSRTPELLPEIPLPRVGIGAALLAAAAGVIIKNPVISRRFWEI